MMLENMFGSVLSAAAVGAAGYILALYKAKKKENDALKAGLQALLRDRIIQAYNHYCDDKKWIPIYALESINACYKSYEALGENGVINGLIDQLNKLPNFDPRKEHDENA